MQNNWTLTQSKGFGSFSAGNVDELLKISIENLFEI